MPTVTAEQVTAHASTDQRELLMTPPTTTTLLRIPRRKVDFSFLHMLQAVKVAWIARHCKTGPSINPGYPRQETIPDRAARIDLYLYARSLSG